MVFLFGDSSPFPLDFNFLATLEKFMASATRVVMLEAENHSKSSDVVEHAAERAQAVEAVEQLHSKLMRALEGAMGNPDPGPSGTLTLELGDLHPACVAYAKKIRDLANRLVEEQRLTEKQLNEAEANSVKSTREQRAKEIRAEFEKFFRSAQLETLGARVSVVWQETHNETNAVIRTPGGIVLGFVLGASKVRAWQGPRKVSDFVTGMDLMVGVKKKGIFNAVITADSMNLDEYVVSRADLNAELMLLTLRKKIDQKDSVVFKVKRSEHGLSGDFDRPDDPNVKSIPSTLGPEDLDKLDRLWRAIRTSFEELMPHKEALTHLELDGKDVVKSNLALQLVARLVSNFAPIVLEITKKSPNKEELSLKIENDDGRREEIYLRKEVLTKNLEPLNASGREAFAPLGLDSWVPAISVRPPGVRSAS
jgi:hypothetical protein